MCTFNSYVHQILKFKENVNNMKEYKLKVSCNQQFNSFFYQNTTKSILLKIKDMKNAKQVSNQTSQLEYVTKNKNK